MKLVYQGIDTLDVAVMGAAPDDVRADLEDARNQAEADQYNMYGIPILVGSEGRRFIVKSHGARGGYRYTLIDEKTGTIISLKNERRDQMWNVFVSCRAHSLLSRGYEGMKAEIDACLRTLGIVPLQYSVNRVDYALDFLAPELTLDMACFVAMGNPKIANHYATERDLNDLGDRLPRNESAGPIGSVMRGGRTQSVTIGKMPGRQVIVYDKTAAARAQHTPYWFPAWSIDPDDPGQCVWRVELRAGRCALERLTGPTNGRDYPTIDALHPRFLRRAVDQVRYVQDRNESNVSRSELHPLWKATQQHVCSLPPETEPPLTPEYILDMMRKEREAMALAQGFGTLNNLLTLKGLTVEDILRRYPQLIADQAREYVRIIGEDQHKKKLKVCRERNIRWLTNEEWQQVLSGK